MVKGVIFSVLASTIFGLLYFYSALLQDFDGTQVFGWRMISLLPFLTLFMWLTKDIQLIREVYFRLKKNPAFFLVLVLSSLLMGVQLWLFLWAPMNGRGMQVSLGYFLLPLVLVLVGSLFYKEKISNFQKIAVALACLGVGHEIWRMGSVAWETILVALGYSAYFFMRRFIKTDHLGGFWWDNVLVLPVAAYFISTWSKPWQTYFEQPHLIFVIIGLGILSAIGLGSYILASRYLPMVLFGLLSYLEPILLAMASLMLGESIRREEWLTYIPIWCAVVVLIMEGILHLYKQYRAKRALAMNMEKFSARVNSDR
ncbi:EamA family transporter RarD [Acinetobacter sp.]|uniref:EamA family transporter RarD n=1 Tax=Acinetobacter sp. TaxID=472 RepID=UPI0031D7CC18